MASNYKFSSEEIAAIKAARRETKDKRADARLKALELRAEGLELKVVDRLCDTICSLTPDTIFSITGRDWIIKTFN